MKFTRKLNYEEIKKLSQKEDRLYHKWLEEQYRIMDQNVKANWTFQDWMNGEYSLNMKAAARREFFLKEEQIEELVKQRISGEKEKFTFFWETESVFSQWHRVKFNGPVYMWDNDFFKQMIKRGYPKELVFSSSEQWMMYCKAMLFMDMDVAERILEIDNPREIKGLGRQVKRFDVDRWRVYRWRFVYQGNKYKFAQNKDLREKLFSTAGTTLVEASPDDSIWGIGLIASDNGVNQRSTWKGQNLLGEILTELRMEMMGHY